MIALLRQFGFEKIDAAWTYVGQRAVYHAWRSDARRCFIGKERIIDPVWLLKARHKLHRGWRLVRERPGLRRR